MTKRILSLLLTLLISGNAYAGGSQPTNWPSNGNLIVSNGTYSPTGIAPINGNCLIGSAGAWVSGACSAGGSVSVTATTPDLVVTPSPGTGTFTIGSTNLLNAQGTAASYTILSTDLGKTVTHNKSTAVAVTLPQAGTTGFGAGVAFSEVNFGAGTATISPTTSTINGAANLKLYTGGWAYPISDGTNWFSIGFPGYGTITTNALTKFIDSSGATTASGLLDNGTTISTGEAFTVTGATSLGSTTLTSITGSTQCLQVNSSGVVSGTGSTCGAGGGGSGTVNSGTANQLAFYSSTGTAVSGTSDITDSGTTVGVNVPTVVTSASASALTVGASGATNPALTVDASTASSVTGIAIKSAATAGTTTITATDSGSNSGLTIQSKGTGNLFLYGGSSVGTGGIFINGGGFTLSRGGVTTFSIGTSGGNYAFSPIAISGGATTRFLYTGAADTALTASTEAIAQHFNNAAAVRQHATGALTLQRDFVVTGATDGFVGASTLTDGATLALALKNCGTNGTCTNESGLYVPTQALTGTVTNGFALNVSAPSGATNNYAARINGNLLFDGTAPTVGTCGGGSVATGSTNHKGQVTGISAATACTITFSAPLGAAPTCTFTTNAAITPTISTISTTAVTAAMSSLTGTLYYQCL
ncbi:beta strand repeat-containing protein [Limnoglobus roseus]|uniref:Uncharacterized protein n=1 Tax=Limnoglobus roseus TaxID=2598579 RepID=A0A5C1AAF2_9BACT|nr:hypothetical protein [Limnoglobus roseus]QEL14802.1 hypothetical protein PX52LOC_01697 [Limnoglobus roseus]